jgi:hypothetical protein
LKKLNWLKTDDELRRLLCGHDCAADILQISGADSGHICFDLSREALTVFLSIIIDKRVRRDTSTPSCTYCDAPVFEIPQE